MEVTTTLFLLLLGHALMLQVLLRPEARMEELALWSGLVFAIAGLTRLDTLPFAGIAAVFPEAGPCWAAGRSGGFSARAAPGLPTYCWGRSFPT
jgi:hypothetical protein